MEQHQTLLRRFYATNSPRNFRCLFPSSQNKSLSYETICHERSLTVGCLGHGSLLKVLLHSRYMQPSFPFYVCRLMHSRLRTLLFFTLKLLDNFKAVPNVLNYLANWKLYFFSKGLDCNENSSVHLDQRGARKQSFVHAKHRLTSCKV